jgi:hypothetical protein
MGVRNHTAGRLVAGLVVLLLAGGAWAQTAQRSPVGRAELLAGSPEVVGVEALDAEVLGRIVTLLSGYEYFPTAEDLTAVTPDPVPYLLAMVYDTGGRWLPTHHHRAVAALAYYPTPSVWAQLTYLLEAPGTPELMRHHVINALANGFGEAALGRLEPVLYDEDLQLRLTAVSAIGEIRTSRSARALETALSAEPNRLVQERSERALVSGPEPTP